MSALRKAFKGFFVKSAAKIEAVELSEIGYGDGERSGLKDSDYDVVMPGDVTDEHKIVACEDGWSEIVKDGEPVLEI